MNIISVSCKHANISINAQALHLDLLILHAICTWKAKFENLNVFNFLHKLVEYIIQILDIMKCKP